LKYNYGFVQPKEVTIISSTTEDEIEHGTMYLLFFDMYSSIHT